MLFKTGRELLESNNRSQIPTLKWGHERSMTAAQQRGKGRIGRKAGARTSLPLWCTGPAQILAAAARTWHPGQVLDVSEGQTGQELRYLQHTAIRQPRACSAADCAQHSITNFPMVTVEPYNSLVKVTVLQNQCYLLIEKGRILKKGY